MASYPVGLVGPLKGRLGVRDAGRRRGVGDREVEVEVEVEEEEEEEKNVTGCGGSICQGNDKS